MRAGTRDFASIHTDIKLLANLPQSSRQFIANEPAAFRLQRQVAVEAAHRVSKNRRSFPSDEALIKLFFLALRNISKKWTLPIRDWKAALTRFTIQFGERISMN